MRSSPVLWHPLSIGRLRDPKPAPADPSPTVQRRPRVIGIGGTDHRLLLPIEFGRMAMETWQPHHQSDPSQLAKSTGQLPTHATLTQALVQHSPHPTPVPESAPRKNFRVLHAQSCLRTSIPNPRPEPKSRFQTLRGDLRPEKPAFDCPPLLHLAASHRPTSGYIILPRSLPTAKLVFAERMCPSQLQSAVAISKQSVVVTERPDFVRKR